MHRPRVLGTLLSVVLLFSVGCSCPWRTTPGVTAAPAGDSRGARSPANLLRVPDVRQGTDYSCGASALQAVLAYYGGDWREPELMEIAHSDPEMGTTPNNIMRAARELGFLAEAREMLSLEDLRRSIAEGIPVIVALQAWRSSDVSTSWEDEWEEGHYVVVVGIDETTVFVEDPSLIGSLGYLERGEFLERWHDEGSDGKVIRLGIFISGSPPAPPPPLVHVD